MRTIAVGDIHGCSEALAALVAEFAPGPADTVVALGDYIDHGPDARGVVEFLLDLQHRCRLICVMGNHEEMLLGSFDNVFERQRWHRYGAQATLDSYASVAGELADRVLARIPPEHRLFYRQCRDYYETETHIFLHASYVPSLPMAKQRPLVLRWQFLDRRKPGPHASGKNVIVGHTPQRTGEILDWGHLKCIDTDCHRGGWLTAIDVDAGTVWQADRQGRLRFGR